MREGRIIQNKKNIKLSAPSAVRILVPIGMTLVFLSEREAQAQGECTGLIVSLVVSVIILYSLG